MTKPHETQYPAAMSPTAFRAWRKRMKFTAREAAEAIGRSMGMVWRYEGGQTLIDRTVALACWAAEMGAPGPDNPYFTIGTISKR